MKEKILVTFSKNNIDFYLPSRQRRQKCLEDYEFAINSLQDYLDNSNKNYKIVKKLSNIYAVIISCDKETIEIIKNFPLCKTCLENNGRHNKQFNDLGIS